MFIYSYIFLAVLNLIVKMVKELNQENFNEFIKDKAVIDFYADWCMPCQMMKPVFEELSKEININFGKVNTEDNIELARKFNIMSIPCLIVFKNGKEAHRILGYRDKEALKQEIDKL